MIRDFLDRPLRLQVAGRVLINRGALAPHLNLEQPMKHYTQHIIVHGDGITLDLMVKPDTDFDDAFKAWDRDAEEFIMVAGWLIDEIEDAA